MGKLEFGEKKGETVAIWLGLQDYFWTKRTVVETQDMWWKPSECNPWKIFVIHPHFLQILLCLQSRARYSTMEFRFMGHPQILNVKCRIFVNCP